MPTASCRESLFYAQEHDPSMQPKYSRSLAESFPCLLSEE